MWARACPSVTGMETLHTIKKCSSQHVTICLVSTWKWAWCQGQVAFFFVIFVVTRDHDESMDDLDGNDEGRKEGLFKTQNNTLIFMHKFPSTAPNILFIKDNVNIFNYYSLNACRLIYCRHVSYSHPKIRCSSKALGFLSSSMAIFGGFAEVTTSIIRSDIRDQ